LWWQGCSPGLRGVIPGAGSAGILPADRA
jgi:hypothetical protein